LRAAIFFCGFLKAAQSLRSQTVEAASRRQGFRASGKMPLLQSHPPSHVFGVIVMIGGEPPPARFNGLKYIALSLRCAG